jgi:argininosuccinate lyase
MTNSLWAKGGDTTNALVHAFTVGDDHLYDRDLAPYDILGSLAHAKMLHAVGLLDATAAKALAGGLRDLHAEYLAGGWTVEAKDEDVHTKVEALLTARLGDAGKRLHTGRSRNDQVLTAIRLWQKHHLCRLGEATAAAAAALLERAQTHEFHPFPGYTHLQRAMPSSLGLFFGAHAQSLVDDGILLDAAFTFADASPLGSGASYGVGLPLDRAMSGKLLGFSRVGGIAMADANGRGKVETAVLDAGGAVIGDLSRFAADMIFFTTGEAGFFTIGAGFTTGSSIMPQKKNLDLFELLRGRAARYLGLRTGLNATTIGLPSGYSRDLQDTKAMCIDGVKLALQGLAVVTAAAPTLNPVREKILAALTPDIYATDEAYRLVREQGMAFRDAYKEVGRNLDRVKTPDHDAVLRARTHAGSTGNLGLPALGERIAALGAQWRGRREALDLVWQGLLTG